MKLMNMVAITLVIGMLSACGFRLAGTAELDAAFKSTHVSYEGQGQAIAELLKKHFKENKVKVVAKDKASVLVNIPYEQTGREILSLDEGGKVREYLLILNVGLDVANAQEKLVSGKNIRLTRDFLFDVNDLLGKEREEQQLYQEMREDAARLILYRLQAVSSR